MIRVIVQTADAGMAANVGGSVHTSYRTIDVECPALEEFLASDMGTYAHRQVIGVEVVQAIVGTAYGFQAGGAK
jgi:hypothetical protein